MPGGQLIGWYSQKAQINNRESYLPHYYGMVGFSSFYILCLNLSAVFKGEPYIVFIINSSVVHKAAPQLFVKIGK